MASRVARQKLFGRWRTIPTWARYLAHTGYAAKAISYLLVGALALYDAVQHTHAHSGLSQMMQLLRSQTLGTILLGALAAGTCCYGIHRCVESLLGPVRSRSHPVEALHRFARMVGGLIYLGFAALAVDFIISRRRASESQTTSMAAELLRHTLGNSILVAIGVTLVLVGTKYCYDAVSGRYRRSFRLNQAVRPLAAVVETVAIFGISSRALLVLLSGGLVAYSGIASDPSTARGMHGVVGLIQKLPFGEWLFGLIATGFIAYGLFCVVRAIYGTYPSDTGV